jgi:hypothetical protein
MPYVSMMADDVAHLATEVWPTSCEVEDTLNAAIPATNDRQKAIINTHI